MKSMRSIFLGLALAALSLTSFAPAWAESQTLRATATYSDHSYTVAVAQEAAATPVAQAQHHDGAMILAKAPHAVAKGETRMRLGEPTHSTADVRLTATRDATGHHDTDDPRM